MRSIKASIAAYFETDVESRIGKRLGGTTMLLAATSVIRGLYLVTLVVLFTLGSVLNWSDMTTAYAIGGPTAYYIVQEVVFIVVGVKLRYILQSIFYTTAALAILIGLLYGMWLLQNH